MTEEDWDPFDDSGRFDLANDFPDFLDLDQLTLVPAVGPGWHFIIQSALSQMRAVILEKNIPAGSVIISDIKEKYSCLSINWNGHSECLDAIESELEDLALITCELCGAAHCDEHNGH